VKRAANGRRTDGGSKKKLMKNNILGEAEAPATVQPASGSKDPGNYVTTEMLDFLEVNWNETDCKQTILKQIVKEGQMTESCAAMFIVEKLVNRKKVSAWQLACIVETFVAYANIRGYKDGKNEKLMVFQ
jgi:hypothetical protein